MRDLNAGPPGGGLVGMNDHDILTQARAAAAALDGRWYAHFDELLLFAEVLILADHLTTPSEVVEYFRKPWRYEHEHTVWERGGRPTESTPVLAAIFEIAADGRTPITLVPRQAQPEGGR